MPGLPGPVRNPPPWVGPVVGTVAGAIIDKASQDRANKANAAAAQKSMDFEADQAATAYQRAVADLRAAGLNPSLAYKQGGADTASGAQSDTKAVMHGGRLNAAVEAYNQFANGTAQRVLIREQAAATDAQRIKTMAEAATLQPGAILGQDGEYIQQYGRTARAEQAARQFTAGKAEEQYMANLGQTKQTTATAKQQEHLMRTQSTLNEQEFQNEWFRKNVAPYLNSTSRAMQSLDEGIGIIRSGKGIKGRPPEPKNYREVGQTYKGGYTKRRDYY